MMACVGVPVNGTMCVHMHDVVCGAALQAAIECDASDATSMHLLGQWCYSVVSIPWYQRQVATVLFATPPTSSYEEVL